MKKPGLFILIIAFLSIFCFEGLAQPISGTETQAPEAYEEIRKIGHIEIYSDEYKDDSYHDFGEYLATWHSRDSSEKMSSYQTLQKSEMFYNGWNGDEPFTLVWGYYTLDTYLPVDDFVHSTFTEYYSYRYNIEPHEKRDIKKWYFPASGHDFGLNENGAVVCDQCGYFKNSYIFSQYDMPFDPSDANNERIRKIGQIDGYREEYEDAYYTSGEYMWTWHRIYSYETISNNQTLWKSETYRNGWSGDQPFALMWGYYTLDTYLPVDDFTHCIFHEYFHREGESPEKLDVKKSYVSALAHDFCLSENDIVVCDQCGYIKGSRIFTQYDANAPFDLSEADNADEYNGLTVVEDPAQE